MTKPRTTVYLLVKVEADRHVGVLDREGLRSELQSNLESLGLSDYDFAVKSALVAEVRDMGDDLKTLLASTQDQTDAMECAAALANYTSMLLDLLNETKPESPEWDAPRRSTNLDKFNLTKGGTK